MTTLELAQRVCDDLPCETILELSASDTARVTGAFNTAMANFHADLPRHLKRKQDSRTLPAPQVIVGVTLAANATALSFNQTLRLNMEGNSVALPNDVQVNRMASATSLLIPSTAAQTTLTVYGDSAWLDARYPRMVGSPLLLGQNTVLTPFPEDLNPLTRALETGIPRYFQVENNDAQVYTQSRIDASTYLYPASKATHFLRVWPLPNAAFRILFEVESIAERLTMLDLSVSRVLNIADELIDGTLVAMVRGELARLNLFTGDRQMAIDAGNAARANIRLNLPDAPANFSHRVGTPRGY